MKMTNKQIDELNELLVDHSEALTAFYNEGLRYGLKSGAGFTIAGVVLGFVVTGVIDMVKTKKQNKENEEES